VLVCHQGPAAESRVSLHQQRLRCFLAPKLHCRPNMVPHTNSYAITGWPQPAVPCETSKEQRDHTTRLRLKVERPAWCGT
jgi:hypothetical protein